MRTRGRQNGAALRRRCEDRELEKERYLPYPVSHSAGPRATEMAPGGRWGPVLSHSPFNEKEYESRGKRIGAEGDTGSWENGVYSVVGVPRNFENRSW